MNNMDLEVKKYIQEKSKEIFEKIVGIRKHLHQYPELSYQEHQTMDFIASKLDEIGIPYEKGVAGTGIVGLIKNNKHTSTTKCIGLRADIDALPIHEENETDYKSKNEGVMHACGHDVHSSILIGVAEILNQVKDQLPYMVKLIFQPGEEKNPGGASLMIEAGCLQNPKVDEMYALHVFPELPTGEVGFKEGLYMASCDEIYIDIIGKGGHGATPHQTIDPILIGAEIVTSLQTIVSRQCDPKIPCVLNFGHFEGLGATNVVPGKVHIKGTFRTMDETWRADALSRIERQATHIGAAHGAQVKVNISKGYPFLENDPTLTRKMVAKATEIIGEDKIHELPIRLTAEDFSFYAQEIPTCFFRIGVRNENKGITYGVHHPKFDIDHEALKIGMQMMAAAVFD